MIASGERAQTTESVKERRRAFPRIGNFRRGLLLPLMVVILAAAVYALRHHLPWERTDDAQIECHIVSVSSRVTGYLLKVNVENNEFVKAGTELAEIDPKDYLEAVAQSEAEWEKAQAALEASGQALRIASVGADSDLVAAQREVEDTEAGLTGRRDELDASRAQVRSVEARQTKAAIDEANDRALLADKIISKTQYNESVATAESLRADVESARASAVVAESSVAQQEKKVSEAKAALQKAETAPNQVASARAQLALAAADVRRARAVLNAARLNLERTRIMAPVDGLVAMRSAEVGENVQAGQALMALVELNRVWVTANFKETQLRRIHVGQRAVIHVDAYGRDYAGKVESIGGGSGAIFSVLPPENATGNFVKVVQRVPVRIELAEGENRDYLLRPGMSVVAEVKLR